MSEYNLVIIYNITYFLELQFKKKNSNETVSSVDR